MISQFFSQMSIFIQSSLLFLFLHRNFSTTTSAKYVSKNSFCQPHGQEQYKQNEQNNVEQQILKPIQVIGSRP